MGILPGGIDLGLGGYVSQLLFWLGWGLVGILLVMAMFAVYYYFSFPFKINYWPLYGSGRDGVFSVDKQKSNRARKSKDESEWILMYPLFQTKAIEPFDSEYIYPGKACYAFDLNGILIPGRINIRETEDKLRAEVNPVTSSVKNWQMLRHKKHAIEFSERSWWDDNKAIIYGLIIGCACLIACVATVYLTYKFIGPGVDASNRLTQAINSIGNLN